MWIVKWQDGSHGESVASLVSPSPSDRCQLSHELTNSSPSNDQGDPMFQVMI